MVNSGEELLGTITIDDIRPLLSDPQSVSTLVIAGDMMRESGFPVFEQEDPLDEVMRRFGNYRFQVPVVEGRRLVGSLWPHDVIESYNAEVAKRDMASSMAMTVGNGPVTRALPGVSGMSMAEVPAPRSFLGRSLGSIDVRNRYKITILLIKRRADDGDRIVEQFPDSSHVFEEGEMLLAMGTEVNLKRFERIG